MWGLFQHLRGKCRAGSSKPFGSMPCHPVTSPRNLTMLIEVKIDCQFVNSFQHASYYGPKTKLSPCRSPAEKLVNQDGALLFLCAKHAQEAAQRRFIPLGA